MTRVESRDLASEHTVHTLNLLNPKTLADILHLNTYSFTVTGALMCPSPPPTYKPAPQDELLLYTYRDYCKRFMMATLQITLSAHRE